LGEYEGLFLTVRDGWEAIIHFDEAIYNVDIEAARDFIAAERYKSGNVLYGYTGMLSSGEITLKINPASGRMNVSDLERIAEKLIKKVILPSVAPLN
jgi:hypothetical protein